MLISDKAIVIHTTKYSESSIIVNLITSKNGLVSFIVKGARKPKAKFKANQFQPLSLLDIEYNFKGDSNSKLNFFKDVNNSVFLNNLYIDRTKSAITLFLNDVIFHSIQGSQIDDKMFNWLWSSIIHLNNTKEDINNFHIKFLLQMTAYLGFLPRDSKYNNFFDLREGVFKYSKPAHNDFFEGQESTLFNGFINGKIDTINNSQRKDLLRMMLLYYKHHIPNFGEIKSLEILESLFARKNVI